VARINETLYWQHPRAGRLEVLMFVPLTPLDFKRRAVQSFASKTGVIDGDRRFSYAEFGERTDRLAAALLEAGLGPGDRVAYIAYNSYPLLEGYYGVLQAGGILLPINVRLSPREIAYVLNDAEAAFLFVDAAFAGLVEEMWPGLQRKPTVVWLTERSTVVEGPLYDELLESVVAGEVPPLELDENAVAELFYTSGTTGRPKGVMLTHRNLYLHALSNLATIRHSEDDVILHTIPLFHVNGWGTPHTITALGGTHVLLRMFDPGAVLDLVESEHVTRFLVVPTMLNMILNRDDVGRRDVSSLRLVMLGGAPTPPDMVRRAEEVLGCEIRGGYGLSETSPVLSFSNDKSTASGAPDETLWYRRASAGLPLVGVEVRVVADDGYDVAWDGEQVGEVIVRSNVVMKGYWRDQEATEAVIRDGWFHTGDVAVVDREGYITIVDRKKDIIISGGENISSTEIEKILFEHPAVLESAVIGIPDDFWGEVPAAIVAFRPGKSATAEELTDFCRRRLASFKVPKRFDFMELLPKGGTGKILKRSLREPYWEGFSKRVH
jgi:fatty-acyl-CoA synthase